LLILKTQNQIQEPQPAWRNSRRLSFEEVDLVAMLDVRIAMGMSIHVVQDQLP
jgi:hypothetical protein